MVALLYRLTGIISDQDSAIKVLQEKLDILEKVRPQSYASLASATNKAATRVKNTSRTFLTSSENVSPDQVKKRLRENLKP